MEMKDEIIKVKNTNIALNTYVTKEKFINMLENMNFIAVEKASIDFITMFNLNTEKDTVEPKGYTIDIR